MRYRIVDFLGFSHMAHRPPLPRRFGLYCVVAYLSPSLMLQFVPAAVVPYRDLVWLVTLVPAYLLSLHYGMRGAVAGLAMGTTLFTAVQFFVAWNLDAEDWRVTVPIYIAYGAVAISVGWLSEQLHVFYTRAIQGERVAVISQLAVAMRHEVNNALATLLAEGQLLGQSGRLTHPEDLQAVDTITAMARRIQGSVERLTALTEAPVPVSEYLPGTPMIDLGKRGGSADSAES